MIPLYYDLHIHSCLSPCGDDDMTPANLVGMAAVKGLDVIALTDHNTSKNCPAAMHHGAEYGVTVIPGMELTTEEEIHVICLFPSLQDALSFDTLIESKLMPFPNREDIFGNQQIMNEKDEVTGTVENLLINAVSVSFDDVFPLVSEYHGIAYPAHVDKTSTSLISNLGFVPPGSTFSCAEFHDLPISTGSGGNIRISGLQCDLLFRRPLSVGHPRTGIPAVCPLPRNTGYTGSAEQAQKMKVHKRLVSCACYLISHLNLYPTPTSVTMCSGSDGFSQSSASGSP